MEKTIAIVLTVSVLVMLAIIAVALQGSSISDAEDKSKEVQKGDCKFECQQAESGNIETEEVSDECRQVCPQTTDLEFSDFQNCGTLPPAICN